MARQFTIRDMAIWAAVVALWIPLVSFQWLTRFGTPPPGSPASHTAVQAIAAAGMIAFLALITALLRYPFRKLRNSWTLAALFASLVVYATLFIPEWLLDILGS